MQETPLNAPTPAATEDPAAIRAELARLREELERLRQREDLWRDQVRRLSDDHHASTELFEHAHRELEKRRRTCRDLRAGTQATIDDLRGTVADQRVALESQTDHLGRMSERIEALQSELASTRAEAESLRRQESRMARLLDEALSAARTERGRAEALDTARGLREEQILSIEQRLNAETEALRELRETSSTAGGEGAGPAAADLSRVLDAHLQRVNATRAAMGDSEQRYRAQDRVLDDLRSARASLGESIRQLQDELRDAAPVAPSAAQPDAAPPEEWYVRTDAAGAVYGPATLDELNAWAAECRVTGQHEVSSDRQSWRLAETVDALGLDWQVTLADGRVFSPVSAAGIAFMVRSGAIPPDAPARNRRTDAIRPAGRFG